MKLGNVSRDTHKSILIKRACRSPRAAVNQSKSNRHICVAVVTLVLSMCLQALCTLPKLELSIVNGAQVGVDARDPRKKKKKTRTYRVNRRPTNPDQLSNPDPEISKPRPQMSTATLVLQADMGCEIAIDGEYLDELNENQSKAVTVKPGQHTIKATSLSGLYTWTQMVQLENSKLLSVRVELKKKRTEAEETATRADENTKAEEYARKENLLRNFPMPPYKSEGEAFVMIPSGEFLMGSHRGDPDEMPVHRVRISKAFEMSKYEVTQAQWEAVMGDNPSYCKGPNLPVESVSWNDVQAFLRKVNARNGSYVYRLPTEAEWEYACLAGSDNYSHLSEVAWYNDNSESKTHDVGMKTSNAWGLFDMLGNVWEWCQDWYSAKFYAVSSSTDPEGWVPSSARVVRGGSWQSSELSCRVHKRLAYQADTSIKVTGFRLVRTSR